MFTVFISELYTCVFYFLPFELLWLLQHLLCSWCYSVRPTAEHQYICCAHS